MLEAEAVHRPENKSGPQEDLKTVQVEEANTKVLCACGKDCEKIPPNKFKTRCPTCLAKPTTVTHEGYLYEKDERTSALKRYWYKILGPYLYRKRNESEVGYAQRGVKQVQKMQSLICSFVREELEEIFQPKLLLHPFTLYMGETKIKFYAIKKEEKEGWLTALRGALSYSALTEFYEVKVPSRLSRPRKSLAGASSESFAPL